VDKSLLTIAALFVRASLDNAHAHDTIRGAQERAAAGERAVGPGYSYVIVTVIIELRRCRIVEIVE
jgi:hypothetical protein